MHNINDKTLLIFDLDGTLIDSVPDLANSVNFALKNNDLLTHSTDIIRSFVGNGSYQLCKRAVGVDDKVLIDKVHSDFMTHYGEHTCVDTVPYDSVADGLTRLASRYRLAIATNKPERFLPSILARFGWTAYFKMVVGGDSLAVKKPEPMPLLHICNELGVTVERAIMIGDSKNDIIAGQRAGMMTLGLSYGYNYDEPIERCKPDVVFDEFGALVAFLLA